MPTLLLFITTLLGAFFLDMLWLGLIAKNFYAMEIGMLMRKSGTAMAPNWTSAALVYVAISVGILCFVLPRAQGNYLLALGWGALFGAVLYGVYDFTNFSILANWPLKITIFDFFWGIFLCAVSSCLAAYMQHCLNA